MTMYLSPATDETEKYMFTYWCTPVVERTHSRTGISFTADVPPGREGLEAVLPDQGSVFYFGHGTEDALGIPALIDIDNVGQIKGTLVAVACDAAEALGPTAIALGAQTFVGFAGRIPIVVDPEYDAVIVDNLSDLASDWRSPNDFRMALRAACLELSDRVQSFPDRYVNAPLIAIAAEAIRGSVQVLGPG